MTKSVHGIMDDSAIALFNNTENTIFYGFLSFAGIIPIHNFGHVSQSQYEWKVFFFTVFSTVHTAAVLWVAVTQWQERKTSSSQSKTPTEGRS